MKSLFVSRKKYEMSKNNEKILNEERIRLVQENKSLQIKLANSVMEVLKLKKKLKNNKKKSTVNTFRQCKKCGRLFKVKSSKSQRCHCDNCIKKMKGR